MQKLAAVLLLLQMLSNSAHARCINAKHRKSKIFAQAGQKKETYQYGCSIKASEPENFDDGYCKNCGCHMSDHDNLHTGSVE